MLLSKPDMSELCVGPRKYKLFSWPPSSYLSQPGCGYCLYWTPLLLRLLAEQRGSASRPAWQFRLQVQSREPAALKIREAEGPPEMAIEIVGIRNRGSYLLFVIPPPCSSSLSISLALLISRCSA